MSNVLGDETRESVPLLIIDDLSMRKLPHTLAEDLLITSVRDASALDSCRESTPRPAVPMPAVARFADRKRREAPPARQQVQDKSGSQPLAHASPMASSSRLLKNP